jgi:hypothetical protein
MADHRLVAPALMDHAQIDRTTGSMAGRLHYLSTQKKQLATKKHKENKDSHWQRFSPDG